MPTKKQFMSELTREKLIELIEERAEDVCGGKCYEYEVRLDEVEEETKRLEEKLKQAQENIAKLSEENKGLKKLVNTLLENKELKEKTEILQLKNEIQALKNEKQQKSPAANIKKLQQEVEDLKSIKEEVNQLKMQEHLAAIRDDIKRLKYSRDGINKDLCKKDAMMKKIKIELDRVDQKQRETRLRIVGVPEEDGEEVMEKITRMAKKKLGIKTFKEDDVELTHRSGKKKQRKTRDIIVQFRTKAIKDQFQEQRKKLYDATNTEDRVYLNDDLTEFRQKLLFDARQLAKRERIKAAWSQHGSIMILKDAQERPIAISTYDDLRKAVDFLDFEECDDEETDIYGNNNDSSGT